MCTCTHIRAHEKCHLSLLALLLASAVLGALDELKHICMMKPVILLSGLKIIKGLLMVLFTHQFSVLNLCSMSECTGKEIAKCPKQHRHDADGGTHNFLIIF